MRTSKANVACVVLAAVIACVGSPSYAQKKYDQGASDTEIKIGNIGPYSGPASAYSVTVKTLAAYMKKVNAEGGINGRMISFISYDDAYSPSKTVEQARKLVEGDEVLLLVGTLGTTPNSAIQKYLNAKKVPQLFVSSGASRWNDPQHFPWTMGWQPSYQSEGRIYAKYILASKPTGRLAVFYQNDDAGKDYLKGLKEGLGAKAASMIVMEDNYEVSEPTIDTHIVKLKGSGADVLLNFSSPKFTAQAIRKMAEIEWKPLHIVSSAGSYIASAIKPAGFDKSQGIVSAFFTKDAGDPRWKDDPGMKTFNEFVDKYYPESDRSDGLLIYAYCMSKTLVQVLKQAGDDLSRENIMKQAASIKDLELDGLLPGIKINTSPTDFAPIEQLQLMRLKGETWEYFGEVIDAHEKD